MSVPLQPTVNALLNGTCAVLLLLAWAAIRAGRREAHRKLMLAALTCSALFLASYVAYHLQAGSVRFQGTGPLRTLYFAILISHTILAAAIVPLVGTTLLRALRGQFVDHRRIARLTLPLWGYVSVTGVVIYGMLYHL